MADRFLPSSPPPPAPSARRGVIVLLTAPFAGVALLVFVEWIYANHSAKLSVNASLRPFHGILFLCELVALLAGLMNVLLIPTYLSELDPDAETDGWSRAPTAFLAAGIYLAALIGAFVFVVLLHLG